MVGKIEFGGPNSTLISANNLASVGMNTITQANILENDHVAIIALHFAPDRVNTFISRVMDDMPGDEYLPYKILLSAGIYRVYAHMISDIDAIRAAKSPLDVGQLVHKLVHHAIGGPRSWSSTWCIDKVVEFVSSRA